MPARAPFLPRFTEGCPPSETERGREESNPLASLLPPPYRHDIDRSAVGAALMAKTDIMIPRVSIRFLNVTVGLLLPPAQEGVGSERDKKNAR